MNKIELDGKFNFLLQNQILRADIYVVADDGVLKVLNVVDDCKNDLVELVVTSVKSFFTEKENYSVVNYSSAQIDSDTYYLYDLPEEDGEPNEIRNIKSLIGVDYATFGGNGKGIKDVVGLYIRVTSGEHSMSVYKSIANVEKTYAKKGCKLLNINNRYERLNGDLLHITPDFEIFYIDNKIILTKLSKLEKNVGFKGVLKNTAQKAASEIKDLRLVTDIERLKVLCDQPAFARKLIRAVNESEVLKGLKSGQLTNEDIVNFVLEKKIKIKHTKGKKSLYIKGDGSARELIKVLSDDYLKSELTKTYYEASRKTAFVPENSN